MSDSEQGWDANRIVGTIFLVIDMPTFAFFTLMLFLWRDRPLILKRQPIFVVFNGLFATFSIIDYAGIMVDKEGWPCSVHRWGQHLAAPIFYTTYLIRCWCLYFQYHLAHNRVKAYFKAQDEQENQKILDEDVNDKEDDDKPDGNEMKIDVGRASTDSDDDVNDFFLRNQRWVESKRLYAIYFINLGIWLVAWLIASLADPDIADNCDISSFTENPVILYVYLVLLVYAVIYAIAAKFLWKVQDAFDIKSEFKGVVMGCLLVLILLVVFSIGAKDGEFYGVSTGVPAMITYNVCMFFTVIKPVYSSWRLDRAEQKRFSSSASGSEFNLSDISTRRSSATLDMVVAADGTSSSSFTEGGSSQPKKEKKHEQKGGLYDLLHSKKGFKAFKEFLTLEFSVENILFWDAVNKFHKVSDSKLVAEANKIHENFISDKSHTQVNLDVNTVKELNDRFREGKIDREVFDHAQHFIFELMKNDSYRRFVRSKYNIFKKERAEQTAEN